MITPFSRSGTCRTHSLFLEQACFLIWYLSVLRWRMLVAICVCMIVAVVHTMLLAEYES